MRAHRKRCQTTSQGLENAARRVGQTDAIAASRRLTDAHGIARASAPNTRVCLADTAHDQYSDRLLGIRTARGFRPARTEALGEALGVRSGSRILGGLIRC